jgi:tetratricopeptide (TPR) repeat protein
MRSLVVTRLCSFLILLIIAPPFSVAQSSASSADGLANARELFRKADFRGAAAAFQKIIDTKPSPEAYSGLVRSWLKADDVKAADESSQKALAALPDSALTHAARGDVLFRRGMISEAEDEYQTAFKLDDKSCRAWLGQGKVDEIYTRHKKSREAIAKAHELDPEDGDALYEWAIRQPFPDSVAALEKHLANYHDDAEQERHEREYKELIKALAGRKVWILAHDIDHTEIKMELLTIGANFSRRGFGLRVRLNDRATATLLLDTGSSGVVITRKLAEKIGAHKLSEQSIEGVGKSGPAAGYKALVDKITIGDLEFHDCLIQATPREIPEVDGVIGADVFSSYLINLNISAHKLQLEPLPADSDPISSKDTEAFTHAFTFGHFLLVPTGVGKKEVGLFVIDSGSNANTISPEQAGLIPQMRAYNMPMSGASGSVNSAFVADNATLRFARVNRKEERISTVDLHSISKDLGVEISGQLGFAAMDGMKVIINYRDGLVQFTGK